MTSLDDISAIVARVRDGFSAGVLGDVVTRRTQLRQLRRFLVDDERLIAGALYADLGKAQMESYITEIGYVINVIDHALDRLNKWTQPSKVWLPIVFRPGSGRIVPEPLGTVLIMAPWNYPIHLTLSPLVPALSAGNSVILKPSEVAPATAMLLEERLPRYLDSRVVQVVTGGVPQATALLAERFDHIFYTGNGVVGRIVMRAAAEHLTPVTLELGGKSPAIVAGTADVRVSARRTAWGKLVNAGQTCVAPDYALVDNRIVVEFVDELRRSINELYGADPSLSPDYGRIVNQRHFDRLTALLDSGGYERIAVGGTNNVDTRYFAPTVLTGVSPDAAVMREEIFGPILPIITYERLEEAIEFVNARPKPLTLYVFAGRGSAADQVIAETSSGGVTINHTLQNLGVPDFPFGGVGASGFGSYHGESGFRAFSHSKPVLRRATKPDPPLAYPPYTSAKRRVLRKLI